jgi:parallel beta-helix repeat protein
VNFRENWIDISIYGMHNKIDSCVFNNSFLNIEIWSNSNSIISNQFSNCYRAISFQASFDNTVENNSILHAYTGILLQESYENGIKNNAISNCLTSTITISSSSRRNLIVANTLSSSERGMTIDFGSNSNIFFHNTLMNNGVQVSSNLAENTWDNGYPSGGNYWSDHTPPDLYSGLYQNQSGSDGIMDTAYTIDANNQDNYPLTKPYGGYHDIGVTNITASKTIVGQGYKSIISTKIINYGINTETFSITAYANTTVIDQKQITLTSRNSTTATFTWNTTGFAKGNYTISAYAWPVSGETDTGDNALTDGVVYVGVPGDVDANHKVEIKDILLLAKAYGTNPQSPNWNPNLDVNGDDKVDIKDILIAAKNYGKTDP